MIYGSDCQGLLKPIQLQDSGSHFLSFMAHLMNSHHQLTCLIIVKTLIEVVVLGKKKKSMKGKEKQQLLHHIYPPVPKTALAEVPSPIIFLNAQPLADLANDSSLFFYSRGPAFAGPRILLVGAFSSPDGESC